MTRKEDARRKIQFGGLVVKAGLDGEEPAVVLGLLVEAARALAADRGGALRHRFKRAGDRAFADAAPARAAEVTAS